MSGYLRAGTHDPVEITSHRIAETTKGTKFLRVEFRDPTSGLSTTWSGFLSDRAWPHTARALEAMGWNPAAHGCDVSRLDGTRDLVGRRVQVVVREETYRRADGSTGAFAKVRFVNPCGSRPPARAAGSMEKPEAEALAARLRALEAARRGAKPAGPPAEAAHEGGLDGDVPF